MAAALAVREASFCCEGAWPRVWMNLFTKRVSSASAVGRHLAGSLPNRTLLWVVNDLKPWGARDLRWKVSARCLRSSSRAALKGPHLFWGRVANGLFS